MCYFKANTLPEKEPDFCLSKERDYSINIDRSILSCLENSRRTRFLTFFFLFRSQESKEKNFHLFELIHTLLSCLNNGPCLAGCRGKWAIEIPLSWEVQWWWCLTTSSTPAGSYHLLRFYFPLDWSWKRAVSTVLKRAIDRRSSGDVEMEVEVGGAHLSGQCIPIGRGNTCLAQEGASRTLKALLVKRTTN